MDGNEAPINAEDAAEGLDDEDLDPATELELRKLRYEQQKFLEKKEVGALF